MHLFIRVRQNVKCAILYTIASLFSVSAFADPVTWYLKDARFQGESRAIGSFTYDADTNTYSNINITTTPGTVIGTPFRFDTLHPAYPANESLLVVISSDEAPLNAGDGTMRLIFEGQLDTPNPYLDENTFIAICENDTCNAAPSVVANIFPESSLVTVPPNVTPSTRAVPTLSSYGLVITILGLLVVATRQLSARKGSAR